MQGFFEGIVAFFRKKDSRWYLRPLRIYSRSEAAWVLCLLTAIVALCCFLDWSADLGKKSWPEATERYLKKYEERLSPGALEEYQQASWAEQLKKTFSTEYFLNLKAGELGKSRFWYCALFVCLVLVLMLLVRSLWCAGALRAQNAALKRQLEAEEKLERGGSGAGKQSMTAGQGKLWILGVMVLTLVGLWMRAERIDLSLYNDEIMNMKRFTYGNFLTQKQDEPLRFIERDWADAWWDNSHGINPTGYTVLSKYCLSLWQRFAEPVEGQFVEWPLRIPSVLGGAVVFAVFAFGFRQLGLPWIGLMALGFWALHPWALRYTSEARPYGMMLGGLALLLFALVWARQSNRWRAWITVGLATAGTMWVTPSGLWFIVCLQATTGCFLLVDWLKKHDPQASKLRRMAAAGVFSICLWALLAGPTIPEVRAVVSDSEYSGGIKMATPPGQVAEIVRLSLTGLISDDHHGELAQRSVPTWQDSMGSIPALWTALAVLFVLLFSIVSAGKNWQLYAMSLAGLFALVLGYRFSSQSGLIVHTWYLMHGTLSLAVLFGFGALGLYLLFNKALKSSKLAVVGCGALVGFVLLGYLLSSLHHLEQPRQHNREVAELLSEGTWPEVMGEQRLRFVSFHDADFYDPMIKEIHGLEELDQVEEQALREGRELRLAVGHLYSGSESSDMLWEHVHQSEDWRLLKAFPGLEELFYISFVYEFVGSASE